jgi:hypothetical protein
MVPDEGLAVRPLTADHFFSLAREFPTPTDPLVVQQAPAFERDRPLLLLGDGVLEAVENAARIA